MNELAVLEKRLLVEPDGGRGYNQIGVREPASVADANRKRSENPFIDKDRHPKPGRWIQAQ